MARTTKDAGPKLVTARVATDGYRFHRRPISKGTLVSLPASVLEEAGRVQPPDLVADEAREGEVPLALYAIEDGAAAVSDPAATGSE
jgi:hypothetical protein